MSTGPAAEPAAGSAAVPPDAVPAAQAERTALAWRRTALGVGAGAVVAARLTAPVAGAAAWVLAVSGGVAAALLFAAARVRYRAALRALAGEPGTVTGPGPATALVAGLAALTGLAGLVAVLGR